MNLQHVLARHFAPVEQTYDWRDCAYYALALGMGSDPCDEDELPYVYEGRAQQPVPSLALTLGWPAFWHPEPANQIDWVRILHGEQHMTLHQPLALNATIRARYAISAVEDKGPGRGALIHFDTELEDAASGAPVVSMRSVQFLRGDGGSGTYGTPPPGLAAWPADAPPSRSIDYRTATSAALLYRLASRDYMPIHADPVLARAAGFDKPISHGLNNMGLACRALLKCCAPGRPQRLRSMAVRFVNPGYPGDTVRVELLEQGDTVHFRARAVERGVLLLDRGIARLG